MRRLVILAVVLVNSTGFAAGLISNGSFEDDGAITSIKTNPPTDWIVTMPANFNGTIVSDWKTNGSYSLRLSNKYYTSFTAGQNALVYQDVDLTDVTRIYFDINLRGKDGAMIPWDGTVMTAFVKIDSNDVWTSGISDNGVAEVNVPIGDCSGIHTLKFGIRVNNSGWIYTVYWAQWDRVTFDAYCGGYGHYEADIDRDCYVDLADLYFLADNWLRTDLTSNDDRVNLHYDGSINLLDFSILAEQWMLCTNWQDADCGPVELDLDGDLNQDGIVNFIDYAILMNEPDADYNDVKAISEQWLERSWLFKN